MNCNQDTDTSINCINALASSDSSKNPNNSNINSKCDNRKRSIGQFCKTCGVILLDESENGDCVCFESSKTATKLQWGRVMLYRR